ncbi:phosphotransferase enzyme family protein [Bythopirellula goksoeyrii]|uniref:Homoserine kinase n=1 Tax=Bythopirellula goksoeyrii TaxID=1400387 RepID=A0A5B9QDY3_9BACT|nr:phosphotransferase [Bythopirellula goksoeyrii]QEG35146.1 homoserine kinase [Bythopirellula goksoeyrii]
MISTKSSQLDESQLAFLDRFELGMIQKERVLSGGMFSRPVLLTCDTGEFLLRTHRFRASEEAFRFQAESIAAATTRGVPCSSVVQTLDGSWSTPLPGGIGVFALHKYVPGEVVDWITWHQRCEKDPGFLVSLGKQVARLHNSLAQARPGGDPDLLDDLPPIRLNRVNLLYKNWQKSMDEIRKSRTSLESESASRFLLNESAVDEQWKRLVASLKKHDIQSVSTQIVHGDISPVNLVLDESSVCNFIDWDCVHFGHRIYDALGDVLNRCPSGHPDFNRFRVDHVASYLSGYSEVIEIPLTQQEKDLVPTCCLARQLEDLRQRMQLVRSLDSAQDQEYSELIGLRIEMMEQIELN